MHVVTESLMRTLSGVVHTANKEFTYTVRPVVAYKRLKTRETLKLSGKLSGQKVVVSRLQEVVILIFLQEQQHTFVELQLQWNPVNIRSPMGQKSLAVVTRFFLQENVWPAVWSGGPKKLAVKKR